MIPKVQVDEQGCFCGFTKNDWVYLPGKGAQALQLPREVWSPTPGCGISDSAGIGHSLDLMVLELFSSLNDSMKTEIPFPAGALPLPSSSFASRAHSAPLQGLKLQSQICNFPFHFWSFLPWNSVPCRREPLPPPRASWDKSGMLKHILFGVSAGAAIHHCQLI